MLNNVQLNNLHALAPAGTCALLGLCREVAASRSSTAAASNAPSSKKRRQVGTTNLGSSSLCESYRCDIF